MSSLATMGRALLYLRVMTLVGIVRSRIKRLRQPKYLFGALVGVAYVYFILFRRASAPRRGGANPWAPDGPPLPPEAFSVIAQLMAFGVLLAFVVSWVIPRRAALVFSQAEIAFLFPAPVTRRMLIHYRLLSSQFGLALTALILALLFGRGNAFGGHAVFHAIGWWLILATMNLHFTGSSFVMTRLWNRHLTSTRQRVVMLALAAAGIVALIFWTWSALRAPVESDLASPASAASYLAAQLGTGPLQWLLAIPRLLIAPFFAADGWAFAVALGPALLVLVAHYFWVMQSEVSFEEASIARAEKRAERVRAVRQGDWRMQGTGLKAQRAPFTLTHAGRPEFAFLWKNLLSTSSAFRVRGALIATTIVVAGSLWLRSQPAFEPARLVVTMVAVALTGLALLLGPHLARQDLRADLPNTDILKTYPLHGWQIVLGELLTPVAILTGMIWLALLAALLLMPSAAETFLTPSLRIAGALGIAVLAPPICALQLLVPNAAAVVFPAWMQLAGNRGEHGLDVLGQRIIFFGGQLFIVSLTLLPAAISGALIFMLSQWLAGPVVAIALATVAVFVVLAFEVWAGIQWLGRRFERFDLSAELRP